MKHHAINQELLTGIDIGGSKIHIRDSRSQTVLRYATDEFKDFHELFELYISKTGAVPRAVTVAMAGPRDDNTGAVKIGNANWPTFYPLEAEERYPGTRFHTTNDMAATVAGTLHETGVDVIELKPGQPAAKGNRVVVAVSTGIGLGAAAWDERHGSFTCMQCEPGHTGFQPRNATQKAYLDHLYTKYDHPSIETAISGKHGIENLIDHLLGGTQAPALAHSIRIARQNNNPVGVVLLEFATHGHSADQTVARDILEHFGTLLGDTLADFAIAYKATGGVYLTGSVAQGLGEYLASSTSMLSSFVRRTDRDYVRWEDFLRKIPIYLIDDPNVAVNGAFELARELAA